jgi:hypothetical protein
MTELSGTLDGIGLAPLVSFLTGLGKSGRLTITNGPLGGEVFIDAGQVIGAAFDTERGLPALDAIGLALGNGHFGFAEQDTRQVEHNLTLSQPELRQHLEELDREQAALASVIPSLDAVPTLVVDEAGADDEIGLDRDTLRLLLLIDGRRSVADLARERGLLRTLKQLARLSQLRLARVRPTDGAAASAPVSSGSVAQWPPQPGYPNPHPVQQPVEPQPQPDVQSQRPGGTWARWHRNG